MTSFDTLSIQKSTRTLGSKWNGLGTEDDYLKLQEKFLSFLKDEGKSTTISGTHLYKENKSNNDMNKESTNKKNELFNQNQSFNVENFGEKYQSKRLNREGDEIQNFRNISKSQNAQQTGTYSFNQFPTPIRHKLKVETVGEKLEKSRQTRALELHRQRQSQWNDLTTHLSSKIDQKPSNLLIHRSEVEYRQKLEDIELMEIAKELRMRDAKKKDEISPLDWQMSLRDSDEMMVQVGGSWPYPLFIPVKKRNALNSKRAQQIIRKMTMREEMGEANTTNRRTGLGVRTLENEYVRKKYGKEITKFLNHNAANFMDGLLVEGINLSIRESASRSDKDKRNDVYYEDEGPEEIEGEYIDEETLDNIDKSTLIDGPAYKISSTLIAYSTVPNESSNSYVRISNIGTCTLNYQWRKVEAITSIQKQRSDQKFYLTTPSTGSLNAGEEIDFYFTFKSADEGIFSIAFEFTTSPKYKEKEISIVQLRGITIAPRDESRFKTFSQIQNKEVLKMQMQNAVESLIDSLPEPEPLPSDVAVREKRYLDALLTKFKTQNPSVQFVSDEIVAAYHQFSQHIINLLKSSTENEDSNATNDSTFQDWDFSISSLHTFIEKVPDKETKEELFSVSNDLQLATQEIKSFNNEKFNSIPILQNNNIVSSLASRIRYNVLYGALIESIDQICEIHNFVSKRYEEDPKAKGKTQPKSKGPVVEENEEEIKKRKELSKKRQIYTQSKDALLNAIDSAVSSFLESEEQISAFC